MNSNLNDAQSANETIASEVQSALAELRITDQEAAMPSRLLRESLIRATDGILYCIDAILTRHGSHSEIYGHRLSIKVDNGHYIIGVLTHRPDWKTKSYIWYFPLPVLNLRDQCFSPTEGTWSTFDCSELCSEKLASFSEAFETCTEIDGFELMSGEDAEGTSLVDLARVGTEWYVNVEPIFGAQVGGDRELCPMCKHRLDCPCYSPCGVPPSEEGMRRRGVRLSRQDHPRMTKKEKMALDPNWKPGRKTLKNFKNEESNKNIIKKENEKNILNLKRSVEDMKKVVINGRSSEDEVPGVGLNNEPASSFISPGCKATSSTHSVHSSGSSRKVPPLLCRPVAGKNYVPPHQSSRNYEAINKALKRLELSKEDIFEPQVSFGSLLNMNVHHEISDELGDKLDHLHDAFVSMTDRIPSSKDVDEKLSGVKESVKSILFKTFVYGAPIVAITYSVYRLIYAIRHPRECGFKSLAFWALVSYSMLDFFYNLISEGPLIMLKGCCEKLMAFITLVQARERQAQQDPFDAEIVDEESFLEPQLADGIEDQVFNNLSTLILSFFSIQAVGSAPSGRKIEKFMTLVGQLPRASVGISFIMDNVVEVVQLAINFVRTKMLGLDSFTWFEDSFPEVDRWCRKVQKVADESREPTWLINSTNSQRVFELYKEGNSLFLNKYKSLESTRVRNAVQAYMAVLKKLMVPFEQANISGVAPRMEPVTLFLGGAPGVGKSLITIPLLTEVILEVLPEERRPELLANYMDFIYNRQTEHQYWDRYYGQIACVFDDFLQKRDVAGLPDSETMDIIRVTNMFPNVLHMAALENKGNTVFTSRIVVCTSNTFSMKVESIVEPEALSRRFTHTYRVIPKKEFCTRETMNLGASERRLDRKHRDIQGNALNYDAIEFEEMRWGARHEAHPTGRVVNFKQLVQIMVDDYKDRSDKSDAYNAKVKESLFNKYEEMKSAKFPEMEFVPQVSSSSDEEVDMTPLVGLCSSFDAAVDEPGPSRKVNLDDLSLDDIQDFDEERFKIESATDAVSQLMAIGAKPKHCSDLAFAVCPASVIRFGSVRTLWAFSHTVPKFWEQMLNRARQMNKMNHDNFDSTMCRVQSLIELLMIKSNNRVCIEREMFKRLKFDDSWTFVNDEEISLLEKARLTLADFYNHMKSSISTFVKEHPYITIFGTLVTILGLWKTFTVVRKIFGGSEDILDPESGHARKGKNKDHKQKPSKVPAEMVFSPQNGSSHKAMSEQAETEWVRQGGGDLNAIQVAKRIIQKSSYGISVPWKDQRIGAILFIRGRVCIFPRHYVSWFQNEIKEGRCTLDTEICLRNDWLTAGYKLTVREFIDVRDCPHLAQQDIAILVAPNRVHQHADISGLFVTVETLDKPFDKTVHLVVLEDDKGWRIDSGIAQTVHHHAVGTAEHHWRVDVGYKYPFPTMSGDCGSVLLLNNKAVAPGKILGLHVAGNGKNLGLSAALTKDVILSALKMVETEEQICAPSEVMLEPQLLNKPFEANMVPLFKAKRPVSLAGKTKIIRSALYGAWGPPLTKPAYLRPRLIGNDIIDPRKVGLSGYCEGNFRVDPDIVRAVSDNVASFLIRINRDIQRRKPLIFSFEQAVCGIVGVDYCDAIDRTTSPGYPWVLEKPSGFPGKTWWFGREGDVDISTPQAKKVQGKVEEIIENAKKGIRMFHPYVDFPKDERRPIAKADAMKTRSISGCPLDYAIAVRMFFLDFSIFLMANRMSTKSCVGINPRSVEWDVLSRLLNRFRKLVAGDFAGFDKKQIAEFLWALLDIINKWYDDGKTNALVRRVLWSDVVNSIHLFDGDFVQWTKSLPSGHPLTVIINSIIHEMYVQYCYVLLHPLHLHGLQFFHDFVEIQTYGDDGVYSISDVIIDWFNQVTISKAMASFGLTYTDENKSTNPLPFRSLSEVTFLKRGFRLDSGLGRYVAPLSLDTIMEMPYWTKDGPGPEAITEDNVNTALMELSLHGESVFEEYSEKIIAGCRTRMNWFPPASSYAINFEMAMNTREEW